MELDLEFRGVDTLKPEVCLFNPRPAEEDLSSQAQVWYETRAIDPFCTEPPTLTSSAKRTGAESRRPLPLRPRPRPLPLPSSSEESEPPPESSPAPSLAVTTEIVTTTINTATISDAIIWGAWEVLRLEEVTSSRQVVASGGKPGDHEEREHREPDRGQKTAHAMPPPDDHHLESENRHER